MPAGKAYKSPIRYRIPFWIARRFGYTVTINTNIVAKTYRAPKKTITIYKEFY